MHKDEVVGEAAELVERFGQVKAGGAKVLGVCRRCGVHLCQMPGEFSGGGEIGGSKGWLPPLAGASK